jgi:hypothetical protein
MPLPFPVDNEVGLPAIPVFYTFVGERIFRLQGTPLVYWTWFYIAGLVVIIILLIILAVKKFRRRRAA